MQGEPLALVAADGGVAALTLRGWLRLGHLERELVAELRQAAAALAELKQLVDQQASKQASKQAGLLAELTGPTGELQFCSCNARVEGGKASCTWVGVQCCFRPWISVCKSSCTKGWPEGMAPWRSSTSAGGSAMGR